MTKRAQLGMAMFLLAEAVFFFLLILAFVYFRWTAHLSRNAGLIDTALLLASSFAMWRASAGPRWWLWITIILGIAFLIGQAKLYGTTFFTLAGIHGLHIFAGLIALAVVPSSAIRPMAFYWYFFTAVWLAIFFVIYIWSAV